MSSIQASELFNVQGMVFVVTGAGTGIGEMIANALDVNGASKVFILGRRLEKLQAVAANAKNKSIIPLQCDVSSKDEVSKAVDVVASQTPFVNVVIANHGATGPTLDELPKSPKPTLSEMRDFLWKSPMEDFTDTFAVNCSSIFYAYVGFLKLLDAGNSHKESPTKNLGIDSQFIATSSIGGLSRVPGMGFAYSASKAGVIHLMKLLATNMVPYHIRANVIAPGIYPSAMSDHFLSKTGGVIPQSMVPLERVGTPEDVAGVVLFLCSRAGAYLNGNVVVTDGGRLSILPASY